ncbi:MAG: DNA adenine methylase [Chloroflexi bacterium]|nr:DNA adenine methylase [Chloroflexota bacterium]
MFNIADFNRQLTIPTTRYQGSKAKLMPWLWSHLQELSFDSALDAFGGTGVVGYWLKSQGKKVTYNDVLRFNYQIGMAIIENQRETLTDEDVRDILSPASGMKYQSFIADNFANIYYTDEENQWLDCVAQNINRLPSAYKQALAYYALIQACLVKRPFNLFHRRNLYIRTAEVARSFGNKTTWDRPFEQHFLSFVAEVNQLVFDNGEENRALHLDILNVPSGHDLVYFDPPYTTAAGASVDYLDFYHFLEGLVGYDQWPRMVDWHSAHRRLIRRDNLWTDKAKLRSNFRQLFDIHRHSLVAVSYRSDGMPAIGEIETDLKMFKRKVQSHYLSSYQYALSKQRTQEVLVIGE